MIVTVFIKEKTNNQVRQIDISYKGSPINDRFEYMKCGRHIFDAKRKELIYAEDDLDDFKPYKNINAEKFSKELCITFERFVPLELDSNGFFRRTDGNFKNNTEIFSTIMTLFDIF